MRAYFLSSSVCLPICQSSFSIPARTLCFALDGGGSFGRRRARVMRAIQPYDKMRATF